MRAEPRPLQRAIGFSLHKLPLGHLPSRRGQIRQERGMFAHTPQWESNRRGSWQLKRPSIHISFGQSPLPASQHNLDPCLSTSSSALFHTSPGSQHAVASSCHAMRLSFFGLLQMNGMGLGHFKRSVENGSPMKDRNWGSLFNFTHYLQDLHHACLMLGFREMLGYIITDSVWIHNNR